MLIKSTFLLGLLLALGGCGGSNTDSNPSLQGTWYFKSQGMPSTYYGQHVIEQNGSDILITYCDRNSYALRLVGSSLVDLEGKPYYLQPSGTNLLIGSGDTSKRSEVQRFSRSTHFASGQLTVAVPSTESVVAVQDVCAKTGARRFVALDKTETLPKSITITAPYKKTFVRLELAFESVVTGDYVVRDFDTFIHSPSGAVYIVLMSPDYISSLGKNFLEASSGNVRVRSTIAGNFAVEGSVITTVGEHVAFAADVTLDKQPR